MWSSFPSPDYGSEEEGEGYEDASNEYVNAELPDEGLGESDSRSYYAEDPGECLGEQLTGRCWRPGVMWWCRDGVGLLWCVMMVLWLCGGGIVNGDEESNKRG